MTDFIFLRIDIYALIIAQTTSGIDDCDELVLVNVRRIYVFEKALLLLLSRILLGDCRALFFLHNCSVWLYVLMLHIDARQENLIIRVQYSDIFSFDCLSLVHQGISTAEPHRIRLRLLLLTLRVNDLKLVHSYVIRLLWLTLLLILRLVVLLLFLSSSCTFFRKLRFCTATIVVWLPRWFIRWTLPAIYCGLVVLVLIITGVINTTLLDNLFFISYAVW